jgi:hypothetical protein
LKRLNNPELVEALPWYSRAEQPGPQTAIIPSLSHQIMRIAVINPERTGFVSDVSGDRVEWEYEMAGAAGATNQGISNRNFGYPAGPDGNFQSTVVSIALFPLRASVNHNPIETGESGAGDGTGAIYRCPFDAERGKPTLPAPGQFCDTVPGTIGYGNSAARLPAAAIEWAVVVRTPGGIQPVADSGTAKRPGRQAAESARVALDCLAALAMTCRP